MKSKKWLWILVAVLAICIIVPTIVGITKCSENKKDPRDTSIVLVKDSSTPPQYTNKVENGKSGQTYVFKSNANEHLVEVYVYDNATNSAVLDSSKYTLKMYDKDYKEIAMTYASPKITLTDETAKKWNALYAEEDVYFAITLNEDVSFSLVLKNNYA